MGSLCCFRLYSIFFSIVFYVLLSDCFLFHCYNVLLFCSILFFFIFCHSFFNPFYPFHFISVHISFFYSVVICFFFPISLYSFLFVPILLFSLFCLFSFAIPFMSIDSFPFLIYLITLFSVIFYCVCILPVLILFSFFSINLLDSLTNAVFLLGTLLTIYPAVESE